jgi:hypothetical protein
MARLAPFVLVVLVVVDVACAASGGDTAPPLSGVLEKNEEKDASRPAPSDGGTIDEPDANVEDAGSTKPVYDGGLISNSYVTTYTDWTPTVSGPTSLDQRIQIVTDPGAKADRFFSTTFYFANVKDGGYMGLQTDANRPGMARGKIAIFSIWNSTSAVKGDATSFCLPFGGEGIGQSCRLPYEWVAGRTYRMHVGMVSANQWRASVRDETSAIETIIGTIQTPAGAGALTGGVGNFVEYYGPSFPGCAALAKSVVAFQAPIHDPGAKVASWLKNTVGDGACAEDRTVAGTGPATHRMGQ